MPTNRPIKAISRGPKGDKGTPSSFACVVYPQQVHVTALRRYSVVFGTMGGTSVTWYRSALSSRVCGSESQQFSHLAGYISMKVVTCSTGTRSRLLPR